MISSIAIIIFGLLVSIIGVFRGKKEEKDNWRWLIVILLLGGAAFGIYKVFAERSAQIILSNKSSELKSELDKAKLEILESQDALKVSSDSARAAAEENLKRIQDLETESRDLNQLITNAEAKKKAQELHDKVAEEIQRQIEENAFVTLYKDDHFNGRSVKLKFKEDVADFRHIKGGDFDNDPSSAKFDIPPGWKAFLYSDNSFTGGIVPMSGKGKIEDIEKSSGRGDEGSSIKWVRDQ